MMNHMRERQEIIRDFIVAELQKRGLSIKDVAMQIREVSGCSTAGSKKLDFYQDH